MDEFGLNVSTMQPIQLACVKCNARGGRCAGSARQQHASGQVEVQARVLLGAWGKGARELRRENEVWLAASGAPRGKKNYFLASCSSTRAFVRSHSPASQRGLSLRWSRSDPKTDWQIRPRKKREKGKEGEFGTQLNARAVFLVASQKWRVAPEGKDRGEGGS
jgi:hypothetical protein